MSPAFGWQGGQGSSRPRIFRCGVHACVLTVALFAVLAAPALARNAYVTNSVSNNVSVIDTASNTAGPPIAVGGVPFGIAITPDGSRAYATNSGTNDVSVIDTATNTVVGPAIPVGNSPFGIAITPDGSRAYVANAGSASVSVIFTSTNTAGSPIPVGTNPRGVAITPDGSRAYVTNAVSNNVSVIDTATNTTVGTPIPVGTSPRFIAITPDGSRAYVTNANSNNVSVIDTATNTTFGAAIPVGTFPQGIAITPDGSGAYVANRNSNNVSVIDTATNTTVGSPIPVGTNPAGIAFTPDGSRAYVANSGSNDVLVIDTTTNTTAGSPIPVGTNPFGIAITPDQGPVAAFGAALRRGSITVDFNGSGSSDPDGTVARFDWDFGDGQRLPGGGPTPTHSYARPGIYTATLTVTDNEGCSNRFVFTGQTALCNAGPAAVAQRLVDADPPGLRLSGPRRQPLDAAVEVKARCDEACRAIARGTVVIDLGSGGRRALKARRFKLRRASKQLAAGQKKTLKLKVPKAARSVGTKALRNGGKATVRISVKATDAAGNSTKARRRVELVSAGKR